MTSITAIKPFQSLNYEVSVKEIKNICGVILFEHLSGSSSLSVGRHLDWINFDKNRLQKWTYHESLCPLNASQWIHGVTWCYHSSPQKCTSVPLQRQKPRRALWLHQTSVSLDPGVLLPGRRRWHMVRLRKAGAVFQNNGPKVKQTSAELYAFLFFLQGGWFCSWRRTVSLIGFVQLVIHWDSCLVTNNGGTRHTPPHPKFLRGKKGSHPACGDSTLKKICRSWASFHLTSSAFCRRWFRLIPPKMSRWMELTKSWMVAGVRTWIFTRGEPALVPTSEPLSVWFTLHLWRGTPFLPISVLTKFSGSKSPHVANMIKNKLTAESKHLICRKEHAL